MPDLTVLLSRAIPGRPADPLVFGAFDPAPPGTFPGPSLRCDSGHGEVLWARLPRCWMCPGPGRGLWEPPGTEKAQW
jgi:hypothetical protein